MTVLEYLTPQLMFLIPLILAYCVGVMISFTQLKRIGKPAIFALLGCGTLLMITIIFPIIQAFIFVSRHDQALSNQEISFYLGVTNIVRTVLHLIAFSLILVAIFSGRRALPH